MPEYARRVKLSVTIDGHDVTDYMAPSQLDFTYACNSGGKADEVRITLHNRDGRWSGAWKPEKGMSVEAQILCRDWEEPGEDISLPCGSFAIDEIAFSGPPDKVEIKAVSADLTGGLRDTRKTRAWENTSLETVAGQIAGEYGLELFYSGAAHDFLRQDQRNEGDLAFLNRLAGQFGMSCKAHDRKLVLFDLEDAEGRPAAMTIAKTGGLYSPTSYSFKDGSSGTGYARAEAAYTDPRTGTTHKARARALDRDGGKTLTLQNRAENPAQAARMARAALHDKNSEEETARVELMGCPRLVAGQTVALEGFGAFSATWFIKTATHRISGSDGYATSLELSKPCPTEEAGAYEEVCEAAVKVDAETKKETPWQILARLTEKVREAGDELGALILCLPEIAAAMAEKEANANDRQGYVYLSALLEHWLGSTPSAPATPFAIDWQWAWQYERVRQAYADFTAFPSEEKRVILNEAARNQLARQLCQYGYMNPGQTTPFNFIDVAPEDFHKYHHTSRAVPYSMTPFPDGLYACLGEFSLWAFASGRAISLGNGAYRVEVERIAVAICDVFNFEADTDGWKKIIGDTIGLGAWNCKRMDFKPLPPLFDSDYLQLGNEKFREFGQRFGVGSNFFVYSKPHVVETFTGSSYETTCAN